MESKCDLFTYAAEFYQEQSKHSAPSTSSSDGGDPHIDLAALVELAEASQRAANPTSAVAVASVDEEEVFEYILFDDCSVGADAEGDDTDPPPEFTAATSSQHSRNINSTCSLLEAAANSDHRGDADEVEESQTLKALQQSLGATDEEDCITWTVEVPSLSLSPKGSPTATEEDFASDDDKHDDDPQVDNVGEKPEEDSNDGDEVNNQEEQSEEEEEEEEVKERARRSHKKGEDLAKEVLEDGRTYERRRPLVKIPVTRRELAKYMVAKKGVNEAVVALFDYRKSVQTVPVRRHNRHGRDEDHIYRCLGTRKLVGNGWATTDCRKSKPSAGLDNFTRHLKTVHLGLKRGNLDMNKWAKRVLEAPSPVPQNVEVIRRPRNNESERDEKGTGEGTEGASGGQGYSPHTADRKRKSRRVVEAGSGSEDQAEDNRGDDEEWQPPQKRARRY